MANAAESEATYEDVLRAPPNLVAEILNGRLHTHPRPSPRHAYVTSSLDGRLFDPFSSGKGGPGGWWILVEPEVHLGAQVIVPDLAGWRRERLPRLPDDASITLAPDWVCEILSPSTAQIDRSVKLPVYAEHRVSHCWLIDPVLKTLEAFVLSDRRWTLLATLKESDSVRLPPFDAIAFPLDALWA